MKQDLKDLENLNVFHNHRFVSYFSDKRCGLHGFIAIHRGSKKTPAFGATRILNYPNTGSALVDALRLSKTMSRKAALAGLKCGGAKAVIISDAKINNRKELLISYADKVNLLGGSFITGADVGVSKEDVGVMRKNSRYFVGVKVDPVRYTGLGLFYALQASLKKVYGSNKIKGRSIAIQGVGKVGTALLSSIYSSDVKIYIADIDNKALRSAKEHFPNVTIVSPEEIDKLKVDIFSPCALSNCINQKNVNKLKCKIILGGANCQLENDEIGEVLYKKGILYAPDYLVNAGGLISVFDEYEYGNSSVHRVTKRVKRIGKTLNKIFLLSEKKKTPPHFAADILAERTFEKIV